MSTQYDPPLSTQPDWQGQYSSFLPPGDNIFGQSSYQHVANSNDTSQASAQQPRTVEVENNRGLEADGKSGVNRSSRSSSSSSSTGLTSPMGHRRSLDPLGLRQKQPSPIPEQPEAERDHHYVHKPEPVREEPLTSGETSGVGAINQMPTTGQEQDSGSSAQVVPKEEEDDGLDDEYMLEADGDGDGDGEDGDGSSQPQTAAERTAQRRKMKRFRLTHQQTRFLMSEFAKQPHPDAAHRERLSREIPGLSPRQVQVWFQNRRAKIKRLTADDRDRMIKMRAVPDDFDNVQALHSPYGAVHALGTPITPPVDFAGSSYAEHMMRPLMVEVRRPDGGDDHMSPTGLSPAFGSIGFNPSAAAMSSSDILSPLSPGAGDRYGYPGHLSSPLAATPRTSNPFGRQNSLDTGMQMHSHHQRQQIRPLQPLQLRETMSRSRPDNLQSPLRSSMSWKGDSIDYATYHHGGGHSPQLGGRHQSLYQPESINTTPTSMGSYESSTYSAPTVHSPTHMSYSSFPSSSVSSNPQNRTGRLRAVSASAMQPLSLDLRTHYRGGQGLQQPSAHSPGGSTTPGQRTPTGSHHLGVTSSGYTASFPSAPLTAPVDFNLPRTPTSGFRSSPAGGAGTGHDYSIPQMSAPIAPPNDFSQAFQASIGTGASSSRTPVRDSFGGSGSSGILHPLGGGAGSSAGPASSGDRGDDYASHHHSHHHQDGGLLKRKHSFGVSSSGPGSAYGGAN